MVTFLFAFTFDSFNGEVIFIFGGVESMGVGVGVGVSVGEGVGVGISVGVGVGVSVGIGVSVGVGVGVSVGSSISVGVGVIKGSSVGVGSIKRHVSHDPFIPVPVNVLSPYVQPVVFTTETCVGLFIKMLSKTATDVAPSTLNPVDSLS